MTATPTHRPQHRTDSPHAFPKQHGRRLPLAGIAVAVLTSILWSAVGIARHRGLQTGMDLAIFDEAIRHLAEGGAPISTMKSPDFHLWGDHFHPLIMLLAPLRWLFPHTETLLVAQAVLIGVTAGWLTEWGRRRIGWPGAVLAPPRRSVREWPPGPASTSTRWRSACPCTQWG